MSYQVIARKWRPKDFSELVGQEHVSQTLLNALRHQRLHHALLFTGPRGTGKTSSARILAKALRCPNAKDFVPCHTCSECEEIAQGRSLNVIEIDGASNNGVDAVRELRETVGFQPSSGRFKLYIIDEVHMLSTSAFNALLKTLEEPPSHVIFVLATTEIQKIPETVLSRCQRYEFRCIPLRQITAHLEHICKTESITYEPEALWLIAKQGAGSMRDSQSFLDQAITFTSGELTSARVSEVLGLSDRHMIQASLKAICERDSGSVVTLIGNLFNSGHDPRLFAQDLLQEIRNLLIAKLSTDQINSVLDLSDGDIENLKQLGASLSEGDIHLLFDMTLKGVSEVMRSQDPRVVLEMLLLRMASAPRVMQIEEYLTQAQQSPQEMVAPAPRPVPAPIKVQAEAPIPQSSEVETTPKAPAQPSQQSWAELVAKINGVNSIIGAQLENCFLHQLEGQALVLGVSPKMKFLFEKINDPAFKRKVLNYVTTFWGPGYTLEVVAVEPENTTQQTPKVLKEIHQRQKADELRLQIQEHPLVKATQSVFQTEIRSIKEMKS